MHFWAPSVSVVSVSGRTLTLNTDTNDTPKQKSDSERRRATRSAVLSVHGRRQGLVQALEIIRLEGP